ncbi:MAG TPA: DUF1015 domain-containing protein [Candidatus Monoglobus merdigallinarum]|uniref:DUF1015 domain-containing protein n=1 Tax=Candidatus Monoglobus merdigallinarum TaxID=2838698 RepID=A0A9D1PSR7_9FIRM|nr:DUF1015 domain-containing protein [Candidatus Monoglobus merdigallinarum]
MAKVIPFKGLRYNTDKFKDLNMVTAPPYDIITPEEQQELYNKDEYNIIRLDYGMEFESDDENNNKYTRSAAHLNKWIDEQVLVFEDEPAFYIYEQVFQLGDEESPTHSLKGIISLVELEEFSKKIIMPHEETLKKAKRDRMGLMTATGTNMSQIYSLYMDPDQAIADIISECSDGAPDITFTTDDNVIQNIWIIKDPAIIGVISKKFENKQLFIADGHHRYETALNYRNIRHEQDGTEVGTQPYDYTMMMLVSMDDSGLFIFPTHRMIRNVKNFSEQMTVSMLTEDFSASKIYFTEGDYADIIMTKLRNTVDEKQFAFYTGDNYYYLLRLKDVHIIDDMISGKSDAYKHLDVTILHKLVLERYFGIDDKSLAEQQNLVYTRSASEAVEAVRSGEFQCAFLINATKISEIKDISLANEKMPQKSTFFWPKLITGIVINKFDN